MSGLGIRRRLLLIVIVAVAAALAALVGGFNLLLASTLSGNADNLVRARAAAQLAQLHTDGGRLVVGEARDQAAETQAWVFVGSRILEAPHMSPRVEAAARRLARGPARLTDVPSADERLFAAPVVVDGHRLGTVVAGVSLAPYEETRETALISSFAFGGVVLVLVALAARWLLVGSLRPVARMTRQAAAWSEHDLDQRFALGEPHDELTELAATLDGLLDRLAASLRHEQRFSAELSHELRTPLSRVIAGAELALRRPRSSQEYRDALSQILTSTQQLAGTVDALVAAARHEAGIARGTADAYEVAANAADVSAGLAGERELDVEIERPAHPIRLGVEHDLAERILQPVIENACRYSRRRVSISVRRRSGAVVFTVDDDGPGVPDEEIDLIFDPGVRGRLSIDNRDGAGLGLALARRLARNASGDVEAEAASAGGRFLVRLPAG